VSDEPIDPRHTALLALLTERRRDAEARYRQALAAQLSGDAAGDNEGVHGWKASREGGADVALLEMLDQTVRQIDAAMERLHLGAYGRCAKCGEPIPLARLRAVPFATRCVPCQSRRESGSDDGAPRA
jgi:DnaK suppressor protein